MVWDTQCCRTARAGAGGAPPDQLRSQSSRKCGIFAATDPNGRSIDSEVVTSALAIGSGSSRTQRGSKPHHPCPVPRTNETAGVINLFDDQPLGANRKNTCNNSARRMYCGAIDGCPEFAYRASNSGLSVRQHRGGHPVHFAQRMSRRHSLFQRYIAEHSILNPFVSSHIDSTTTINYLPQAGTFSKKFQGCSRYGS